MEFLLPLFLISSSLLPSLGLAVSGQEEHGHLRAGVHVSVAYTELPMVAASVLGADSWLRTHVLAHYPAKHITAIFVGHGVDCSPGQELAALRLSRAVENLHRSLVRWGLADEIKTATAAPAVCVAADGGGEAKRRLYGRHHLPPPSSAFPPAASTSPTPGVPLSFAPNSPPEVVPSVPLPPTAAAPAHRAPVVVPMSPPPVASANPPDVAGGVAPSTMLAPCSALPAAATSPSPWYGAGGNGGGLWCVAKPTVPLDKLQEAMDYACGQYGVDCQEIAAGGSCFNPDSIASHASYAFNSYWQKMKQIGGSCNFGGTAMLINSDPSYLQCRFMLS